MRAQVTRISAILRKDTLMFWPMALLSMLSIVVFIVAEQTKPDSMPQILIFLLTLSAYVATGLLIASVLHQDGPVSIRQDWLTRAVSRGHLVTSKAIFIVLLVLAPSVIGRAIAGWAEGESWVQIFLSATSIELPIVTTVMALCVIAILTASLLHAATLVLGLIVIISLLAPVSARMSGMGEEVFGSGSGWLVLMPRVVLAVGASTVLIWLMYWRRRIVLARVLFALTALLLLVSPGWSLVFAVQKRLSADPAAAAPVTLRGPDECFPAILINPPLVGSTASSDDLPVVPSSRLDASLWDAERRGIAGVNAIGFQTRVVAVGVPDGWKLSVGRVAATYVDGDQDAIPLRPARHAAAWLRSPNGDRSASHFWLLPRQSYERLQSAPVQLQLDYSLTLLRPSHSAQIPIDGKARYVAGFGHCTARPGAEPATIAVECYKRGTRPALVTASLAGAAPHSDVPSDYPDYTPSVFELSSGKRHMMMLRGVSVAADAQVELTSFEARAHFDRRVVVDGVLGGPPSVCPAPSS